MQIDTGMNRLGFSDFREYARALELLLSGNFLPEGIYTHFTDSENAKINWKSSSHMQIIFLTKSSTRQQALLIFPLITEPMSVSASIYMPSKREI